MTPRELCDRAASLAAKATKGPWINDGYDGRGWYAVRAWPQKQMGMAFRAAQVIRVSDADLIAASRDLVPQLAAALREACEWVDDLTDDDEPGVMCHRCGAYDTHRGDCPKTLARAFLARDVEVESGV